MHAVAQCIPCQFTAALDEQMALSVHTCIGNSTIVLQGFVWLIVQGSGVGATLGVWHKGHAPPLGNPSFSFSLHQQL